MFNIIQRNILTAHSEEFMQRPISGITLSCWAVQKSLVSFILNSESTGVYPGKTLKMYLPSGIGAASSYGASCLILNCLVLHTIPITGAAADIHYQDLKDPVLYIGKR